MKNSLLNLCSILSIFLLCYVQNSYAQESLFEDEFINNSILNNEGSYHFFDANLDGTQDIIKASSLGILEHDKIIVMLNDLSGEFENYFTYTIPIAGYVYKILDIEGDGDFDIILRNYFNNRLYLIEQHCFMQFKEPIFLFLRKYNYPILTANFNDDKYIDFYQNNPDEISIWLSNDGILYSDTNEIKPIGNESFDAVKSIDYNSDGKDELIIASKKYEDNVWKVELNLCENIQNGSYTFSNIETYTRTFNLPSDVQILTTHLNDDKQADFLFAIANESPTIESGIDFYTNNGNKTFIKENVVNFEGSVSGLSYYDINNDGLKEIIASMQGQGWFYCAPINENYSAPIFIKDRLPNINIDGNPKLDYVDISRSIISTKRNYNGFVYEENCLDYQKDPLKGYLGASELFYVDFDHNGSTDIVGFNKVEITNLLSGLVFLNNNNGVFSNRKEFLINEQDCYENWLYNFVDIMAVEDFNNDGHYDVLFEEIIFSTVFSPTYSIAYSNGDTYAVEAINSELDALLQLNLHTPFFLDMDNKNGVDIILESEFENIIYLNDGNGNFNLVFEIDSLSGSNYFDIDNNGFIDIASNYQASNGDPIIHFNYGDNQFIRNHIQDNNLNASKNSFAHLNNDAFIDFFTYFVSGNGLNLQFYENDQSVSFNYINSTQIASNFELSYDYSNQLELYFHDFDQDGNPDLLVKSFTSLNWSYYLAMNNGAYNFSNFEEIKTLKYYNSLKIIDIDNDSDLDIIASLANKVILLRNQTIGNEFENAFLLEEEEEQLLLCNEIILPELYNQLEMQIFDLQGKLISKQNFENTSRIKIDFNASKGMYIARVKTNTGEVFTQKFIK